MNVLRKSKNIKFILAVGLCVLMTVGCSRNNELVNIEKQASDTIVASITQPYILLDVRTPEEYKKNGLPQATLIPYDQLGKYTQKIEELTQGDKTMPIKVYCHSGRRAGVAITSLQSLGYQNLENLKTRNKALEYVNKHPINAH